MGQTCSTLPVNHQHVQTKRGKWVVFWVMEGLARLTRLLNKIKFELCYSNPLTYLLEPDQNANKACNQNILLSF